MINVIASIYIKENCQAKFLEIFRANIPAVLQEQGCIEYLPTVDVPADLPPQHLDSQVVTIVEKWERLEDLHAHLAAPHMLNYKTEVKDLVEKVSIKVLTEAK